MEREGGVEMEQGHRVGGERERMGGRAGGEQAGGPGWVGERGRMGGRAGGRKVARSKSRGELLCLGPLSLGAASLIALLLMPQGRWRLSSALGWVC
jgi:hypothetical protein